MTNELPASLAKRFRVVKRLAAGGFGVVFEAVQPGLERRIALKVLKPSATERADLLERFRREAVATAALSHPNIVRIFDHGVDDEVPWIAYEFLAGGDLQGLLEKGPLAWNAALKVTKQVAAGLDVAHQAGILHRDIKPQNVLQTDTGMFKVTDFGLARLETGATMLTETGVMLGTPYYMAPELIRNPAGVPADQYAVGVMLFQMLTGKKPFTGSTYVEVMLKHENAPRPVPSEWGAGVSPSIDAFVLRLIAVKPEDRFESMAAVVAAAEELLPVEERSGMLFTPADFLEKTPVEIARIGPEDATPAPPAPRSRPTARTSKPGLPRTGRTGTTPKLSGGASAPDAAPGRARPAVIGAAVALIALAIAGVKLAPFRERVPDPGDQRASAPPVPPSSAGREAEATLRAAYSELRARRDKLGMVGHVMFKMLAPDGDTKTMLREVTRLSADHTGLAGDISAALKPIAGAPSAPADWSEPAVAWGARLAVERLLARQNADRANRFRSQLTKSGANDFLGSQVGFMIGQRFSLSLLAEVDSANVWLAAVAGRAAERPLEASEMSAWALFDVLRAVMQFSQTPIEETAPAVLIQRGRRHHARVAAASGPAAAPLERLLGELWTIGIRGNVPESQAAIGRVAQDAALIGTHAPGMAPALGSFESRLRVLYPPRGGPAPAVSVGPAWPFPR